MIAKEQIKGGIEILKAVADAIRELKSIPSGTLYARVAPMMSLEVYDKVIGTLKGAGLVREDVHHVLIWIEPS